MSRGALWTTVVFAVAGGSLPAIGAKRVDWTQVLPPAPLEGEWFQVADEDAVDAGWMGLQLAPVPAALASHLGLDDAGLMVNNIFVDGPADQAGMQQYDVIVEVDGHKISSDVKEFADHIRGRKAGTTVTLTVYRKAQKQSVPVQLGEVPRDPFEHELKFEEDPDVARRRSFGIRGRILRPGPEGWVLDELGELPDIEHLERWIERWGDGRRSGPEVQEGRRVTADGRVLHVRRDKDGTIVVRRYEQKGEGPEAETQAEAKTYKDMEELRTDDPEAYGLLRPTVRPGPMDEIVQDYQEAVRQYMDKLLKEHRRVVPPPFTVPAPPALPGQPQGRLKRERQERLFRFQPRGVMPDDTDILQPAPPEDAEARFEVHPDGSISVEVEDGSTQLKMTFGSEEEFKSESPRLYERYKIMKDKTR